MAVKSRRSMSLLRHRRLRRRVSGTAQRPRLAVFRSSRNISAQLIDDALGATVAAASSQSKDIAASQGKPLETAAAVGKALGEAARQAGVTQVVFDRGGFKYHGRVKALADGAREAGLEF